MTIVCTSDERYLPLLAVLLESAAVNDPQLRFHVRLVNTPVASAQEMIGRYMRVFIMHDNVELN